MHSNEYQFIKSIVARVIDKPFILQISWDVEDTKFSDQIRRQPFFYRKINNN